jgi:hypothetical protein
VTVTPITGMCMRLYTWTLQEPAESQLKVLQHDGTISKGPSYVVDLI